MRIILWLRIFSLTVSSVCVLFVSLFCLSSPCQSLLFVSFFFEFYLIIWNSRALLLSSLWKKKGVPPMFWFCASRALESQFPLRDNFSTRSTHAIPPSLHIRSSLFRTFFLCSPYSFSCPFRSSSPIFLFSSLSSLVFVTLQCFLHPVYSR